MKRTVILLAILCSAFQLSNAADRPKELTEALAEQFEKDVGDLFASIVDGDGSKIWAQSSQETQAALPRAEFERAFRAAAARKSSEWRVCFKRLYCLNPLYGPEGDQVEAYLVSILKCTIMGKEEFVQCIWEFDVETGRWRFSGMPFEFVDAPLTLRYPGLVVKHPERWPQPGPPVPYGSEGRAEPGKDERDASLPTRTGN